MDVNSNLLKLKLDMVYRELPSEDAQARFQQITATLPPPPAEEAQIGQGRVRKVVKPLPRKSK